MQAVRLVHGSHAKAAMIDGRSCFKTGQGESGAIMYGPYEEKQPGRYQVEFEIGLLDDTPPVGDPTCFLIDVKANHGSSLLVEKYLLHSHLSKGLASFKLEFDLEEARQLEYRIFSTGQVPVCCSEEVRVSYIGVQSKLARPRTSDQQVYLNEREFLDGYLRNVSGLIHVGANLGQERRYYWLLGLDVIWVEPIREIYDGLVDRIARYPRQKAINALLSDRTGDIVEFQIANNNGASSSILDLQDHAVLFPDISYGERRRLKTKTFVDMVREEAIPLKQYQALTLDVEGAEKLILEGAFELLDNFAYIKCEVADFPARSGTPTVADLDEILQKVGFRQLLRRSFAEGPGGRGMFWDVVWKKVEAGKSLHEPGYSLPIVIDPWDVDGLEKCE